MRDQHQSKQQLIDELAGLRQQIAELESERKRMKEALRRERELFARVTETSSVGVIVFDCDGRILFANAQVEEVMGLPRDQIAQRTYGDLGWRITDYDGRLVPDEEMTYRQVVRTGQPVFGLRHAVELPHGQRAYLLANAAPLFNASGQVSAVVAIVEDVTAHVQAKEALRESEEAYRRIVEYANEAIVVAQDGMLKFFNPKTLDITGYSRAEMSGKPFVELVHPGDRAMVQERHVRRLRGEQPIDVYSFRVVDAAGRTRWAEIRSVRIDWEGRPAALAFISEVTERVQAEEALRESERKYRSIIESIPMGMHMYELKPDGRLVFAGANPAADAILGVDNAQFVGKTVEEAFPALAHSGIPEQYRRVASKGETWMLDQIDYEENQIAGAFEVCAFRTFPGEMVAAFLDVTERIRTEEELKESEERFRSMFEQAAVGLAHVAPDGRFLRINQHFCDIVGYTQEELLGRTFQEITHPDDLDADMEHVRRMLADEIQSYTMEKRYFHKRGFVVWVNLTVSLVRGASGEPKYFISAVEDIGERKRAAETRTRLATAIEQAAECVVITDLGGTILYVNPAFERITGYDRAEAVGGNPRILKSGVQDAAFYEDLWATITAGQVWHGRFVNKRKDGSLYTEDATISPVRDESDAIVSYVAVKRDVTREVELEERYRQAQKMEAVGRLAGGIAHDFNNLLTAIQGYTLLLLKDLASDQPEDWPAGSAFRADLEEIQRAAGRAAALTNQLLAFSRKQVLRPQVLDLNDLVCDIEKMLRRLIGEDIVLRTSLAPELDRVMADPGQIEQVIMNLAVNARDAMPHGGQLIIETSNVELDATYSRAHPEVRPGPYVALAVSDTGMGMDEGVLSHLYEPFFTTKEADKGTGLGLATVYGIVKQSEGHITAYSEIGKGTTFTIYLPHAARVPLVDAELARSEWDQGPDSLPQGTETVLLVEDDEIVRELAYRVLAEHGYTVLAEGHPEEALRFSAESRVPVDLLVTDVVMPGLGGRELAERLAPSRPEMKVLYISGYTDDAIVHHGVLEPGVAFLKKPFTPRTLTYKVREVLDQR